MPHHLALMIAILLEVAGTSALQASQQFSRLWPTLLMAACYLGAFYFLSLALRAIPVGIAYAIWSGLGIVLISVAGLLLFGQRLDGAALLGLGLIVAGVAVIQLFSGSVPR